MDIQSVEVKIRAGVRQAWPGLLAMRWVDESITLVPLRAPFPGEVSTKSPEFCVIGVQV